MAGEEGNTRLRERIVYTSSGIRKVSVRDHGPEMTTAEYRWDSFKEWIKEPAHLLGVAAVGVLLADVGFFGSDAQRLGLLITNPVIEAIDLLFGGIEVAWKVARGEMQVSGDLVSIMKHASEAGSFDAMIVDPAKARTIYQIILDPIFGDFVDALSKLGQ
ncbi:MAG: hypothetical protein Fur0011_2780 [Candidatus Microgenomates bacterium]